MNNEYKEHKKKGNLINTDDILINDNKAKVDNDEDAKREGYTSAEKLKSELLDIYPVLDPLTRIYYIQFKVVDDIA